MCIAKVLRRVRTVWSFCGGPTTRERYRWINVNTHVDHVAHKSIWIHLRLVRSAPRIVGHIQRFANIPQDSENGEIELFCAIKWTPTTLANIFLFCEAFDDTHNGIVLAAMGQKLWCHFIWLRGIVCSSDRFHENKDAPRRRRILDIFYAKRLDKKSLEMYTYRASFNRKI